MFFCKKKSNRKNDRSHRSERVGSSDLESLQEISFPIDFSSKNIFLAHGDRLVGGRESEKISGSQNSEISLEIYMFPLLFCLEIE